MRFKTESSAKRILSFLLAFLICIGIASGCKDKAEELTTASPSEQTSDQPVQYSDDERFDILMDEQFETIATTDSLTLNYFVANPAGYGIEIAMPTYGEVISPETIAKDREETRELRIALMDIRFENLRADQQVIYEILKRNVDLIEALDSKDDYSYYLGMIYPISGIQAQLPVLLSEYKLRTEDDIEAYLLLLEDTERFFKEIIDFERERSRRGFFMSEANTDAVIESCESYLENWENNLLILIFNEKIDQFEGLDQQRREQIKNRNAELVLQNVLPSYEMLINELKQLRGQGANNGGLSALPDGMSFAETYLQYLTGSDMSSEQAETMLSDEMERVRRTVMSIIDNNAELMDNYLEGELGQIFEETPRVYLRLLEKRIANDYPEIAPVRYVVNEVHESLMEYLSPAFFLTPAIDSYMDNVIYINPSKVSDNLGLFTTLAHEGYPGHMYQKVFYFQQSPHPLRTFIGNSGYTEGWATYVEMESYNYANLSADEATVMQCSQVFNLLIYGLVDLGVNALSWGIEGAASFLADFGIGDMDTVMELFNIVTADPLTYLPYCLGYVEFSSLRRDAEDALGNDFSLIEFHRFLLEFGPAPFSIIRTHMQKWIENAATGRAAA